MTDSPLASYVTEDDDDDDDNGLYLSGAQSPPPLVGSLPRARPPSPPCARVSGEQEEAATPIRAHPPRQEACSPPLALVSVAELDATRASFACVEELLERANMCIDIEHIDRDPSLLLLDAGESRKLLKHCLAVAQRALSSLQVEMQRTDTTAQILEENMRRSFDLATTNLLQQRDAVWLRCLADNGLLPTYVPFALSLSRC